MMKCAAATFVFNEGVNLPIWCKYYGSQFGYENLFVIDRASTDGSTDKLGPVNVIRIARDAFDEYAKTTLMSSFHTGLTAIFDAVVMTDCDEILVPDPSKYSGLVDYIGRMEGDYVNAMGVDVTHIITEELPLDLTQDIMPQRRFGRFHSPECKHLLSRVPIRWLPGLHSSNKAPIFDPDLILFHLKLMDYNSATLRQKLNLETIWSQISLQQNFGAHHRYSLNQFVHQSFLVPVDLINRGQLFEFEFSDMIEQLEARVEQDSEGNFYIPMDLSKMVRIPDRFDGCF